MSDLAPPFVSDDIAHDPHAANAPKPWGTLAAAAAAASAALTACGGGADADAVAYTHPAVPQSPSTPAQASRFLGHAGLDAHHTSIDALMQTTYEGWLNEQMAMPLSQSHKDWLIEKGFNARGNNNNNVNGNGGWDGSLWRKLFSSPDTLRQKTVLAWSELFVVSALGLPIGWRNFAIANYLDTLETHAFGNFRDILEAVTLSSAMGTYLNMKGNKKAAPLLGRVPDENYAREVMQLFTIGLHQLHPDGTLKLSDGQPIETYSNEDTQGLAAVFTGWRGSSGEDATGALEASAYQHGLPMQLDDGLHSVTEKRFLGVTIPANTSGQASLKIALDTLFGHPNTAPFISKFFIQRFVTSNPSPAYTARVAAVFANNGQGVRGDMGAVIKAVLLDPEARSEQASATFGKLREPMIRLLQWGRTFGASSIDGNWNLGFTNADTALGQMPLYAPSVFNFFRPGYTPPNTAIAQAGMVAPEFQILTEPTVVNYINYMAGTVNNGRAVKVDYAAELEIARDAAALTDRYNLWLAAGQLSEATLATIRDAVGAIAIPASGDPVNALRNRIYATITLVMSSPEYLIQK
jgi:uncharacterized protein (DUF1800 family)